MAEFSLGVVGHIDRHDMITALADTVKPDLVEVDDGTLGAAANHLVVIQTLYKRTPNAWLVVLEDDAVVSDTLRVQVSAALDACPSLVASFYCGTGYPMQYQADFETAVTNDVCWLIHRQLRHAVAYAISPLVSKPVMICVERLSREQWAPDDAISSWLMRNNEMVAYSNPSLVDHRDGPTVQDYRMHLGRPVTPGRKRPRVAYKVGTRDTWTDSSVIVRPR